MSLSQSINVGIVGLGWPGERHAEALSASPLGNVYAACDLNAERLKAFADLFDPQRIFTNFDEMLLDSDLDAVVIGLPNALHYPFSLKVLRAGKHVLCEKPPTMNAEQMAYPSRGGPQPRSGLLLWAPDALFTGDASGEESDCRTSTGRNLLRGDYVDTFPGDAGRRGRLVHRQVKIRRRRHDRPGRTRN